MFVVFVGDGCAVVDEHIRGVGCLGIVATENVARDGNTIGARVGRNQ